MAAEQHHVLVVEDDDDLRLIYRSALSFSGFAVHEAGNGLDALRRIDSNPPDLVVLDLSLPGVSGLAVLQEIAAHAHTRFIPIVIVTGSAEDLSRLQVACVLRKPIEPSELVRAVRRGLVGGAPAAGV
jgi:CheY-like chemotaxis protein